MSIRNLQQYRDERSRRMMYDPIAVGIVVMNFWWNAWACCLPRVTAQIVTFPKPKLKEPQPWATF